MNEKNLAILLSTTFDTLIYLVVAGLISIIFGTILGFILGLSTKDKKTYKNPIPLIVSTIISVIRSIPFILLMILIIPISKYLFNISVGFIPSIIALSLIGIATTARLVEQTIVQLNPNLFILAKSLNAKNHQLIFHFILPEAKSSLILGYTSALLSILAYSTVLYIIGGAGLGYSAIQIGYFSFNNQLMYLSVLITVMLATLIQTTGSLLAKVLKK